ncbi:MAG: RIP metalloprotease RseP [Gemmatimonadaceae bacterium]
MTVIISILSPIIVFGLVIFVHELGHFLAAKSVGVYTPRFSIGFGPALWRRRRGETEYILAAFPLGGYVRMASRHDEATAFLEGGSEEGAARPQDDPNFDPNAMIPFGPKPVPEHRWFESKPLWARLYILLAGVTMNFALGLVIAIGLVKAYGAAIIPTTVVGGVRPVAGRPLLESAVRPGDTLRLVNGQRVTSWTDAVRRISAARESVEITTDRGAVTVEVGGSGQPKASDVAGALDYRLPPVMGDVVPGEPAAQAGVEAGDSIVAVDGQPIRAWHDMVLLVANSAGRPLKLETIRKGAPVAFTVTPKAMESVHPITGETGPVGKIGVWPPDISTREPVSVGEAVRVGSRSSWFMATSIVRFLQRLVSGDESPRQLGGPIAITRAAVQAARAGIESFFYLIALLSINVAILNLLPIPILDGGQVMINVLESARGRAFSLRTREYILRAGLAVILAIFAFAMFNDTTGLFR